HRLADRLRPPRPGRAGGGQARRPRHGPVPAGARPPWLLSPFGPEHRAAGGVDGVRVLGHEPGGEPDLSSVAARVVLLVVAPDRGGGVHRARPGWSHPGGEEVARTIRGL